MQLCDMTLGTPQENLALDEALLEDAETSDEPREVLRLWESPEPVVVVGRSSQVSVEVNLAACRRRRVEVLRRTSGGAAVVAARGCLMYAVVLSYRLRPALRSLDAAHRFVLERTLGALQPLVDDVKREGTSDLTLGQMKFSGNSLRCKRQSILYHGTILYDFDLALLDDLLTMPPRQPNYRNNRAHHAFVANLPLDRESIRQALIGAWKAQPASFDWVHPQVVAIVAQRYGRRDWNYQR